MSEQYISRIERVASRRIFTALASTLAVSLFYFMSANAAEAATLALSPSAGSHTVGSTFGIDALLAQIADLQVQVGNVASQLAGLGAAGQ